MNNSCAKWRWVGTGSEKAREHRYDEWLNLIFPWVITARSSWPGFAHNVLLVYYQFRRLSSQSSVIYLSSFLYGNLAHISIWMKVKTRCLKTAEYKLFQRLSVLKCIYVYMSLTALRGRSAFFFPIVHSLWSRHLGFALAPKRAKEENELRSDGFFFSLREEFSIILAKGKVALFMRNRSNEIFALTGMYILEYVSRL